jgi:putative ABC transport system permease protein
MNVLERTREIGVMRAIGASDSTVLGIVLGEGLAIGALSWVGGVLLAIPIGYILTSFVGGAFVHESIGFVFDGGGAVLWLVAVLVLSAAASLLPAWNATRLTVKDVLTYE